MIILFSKIFYHINFKNLMDTRDFLKIMSYK